MICIFYLVLQHWNVKIATDYSARIWFPDEFSKVNKGTVADGIPGIFLSPANIPIAKGWLKSKGSAPSELHYSSRISYFVVLSCEDIRTPKLPIISAENISERSCTSFFSLVIKSQEGVIDRHRIVPINFSFPNLLLSSKINLEPLKRNFIQKLIRIRNREQKKEKKTLSKDSGSQNFFDAFCSSKLESKTEKKLVPLIGEVSNTVENVKLCGVNSWLVEAEGCPCGVTSSREVSRAEEPSRTLFCVWQLDRKRRSDVKPLWKRKTEDTSVCTWQWYLNAPTALAASK